jgi:cobalt-zinc-cadmium efflux system membrane fusion protein
LTLAEALALARDHNPDLLAVRQELKIARGRLVKARYPNQFNPEVGGELADRSRGEPGEGGNTTDFAVILSQELEVAGQRGKRIEEAERNLEKVSQQVRDAERVLTAQVKDAFYQALYRKRRLDLFRQVEDLNRRLREIAATRFQAGEVAKMEVNLAEIRLGQARKDTIMAERDYRNAVRALERLNGREPAGTVEPAGQLSIQPQTFQLDDLLRRALEGRPDLQASAEELRRIDVEIALTQRLIVPNPTLSFLYREEEQRDRIVGGILSIPLPVFDRKQAELTQLAGRRGQASYERQSVALRIQQEEGGKKKGAEEHAQEKDHGEERITPPAAALQTVSFKTVTVQRRGLEQEIRATAVIRPNENRLAHVSPRIPGKAIEVKAVLGDPVEPGQTLAELDSLELGEKKAAFLQARTNLDVARRNYEREERLFKQKISSEKEYLEAKGEFERSQAASQAAREALRLVGLADAEIEKITWGGKGHPLSHFPLVAPFAGTAVEKHITIGELIKPDDKPYTIVDLSTLWILLDIYEKDLGRISLGAETRLAVDAYPGELFQGKVTYVSNLLDETTRTAQARVEIPNPDHKLKPGMFVMATIAVPVPGATAVLAIPNAAVQRIRDKPVAFVQEEEGVFVPRELKLGRDSGPYTEVLEGLREGERVVTEGGFYLKSTLLKEEMGEGHAH